MESQRVENKLDHGYRPSVADRELLRSGAELMSIDQCHTIRELDDSQLVGGPAEAAAAGADVAVKEDVRILDVVIGSEPKVAEMSSLKRKRGRPPRIQGKVGKQPPPPPPPQRMKKDEEDVCFICFDGGSLVLCDRRGCPKAYHPSCIKRDEAFFRSKAKWNCGWHICSSCQKASHYMCYTCTYSLCKGCTKDADYFCVRANKGLCGTCMRTIMLIENVSLGSTEKVQVDFDDKTSWEYLFKVYWIYLKAKLSLTLDELTKAKNPWKGEELATAKHSWKGAVSLTPQVNSSGEIYHVSENCCKNTEANQSKRRKTKNQPMLLHQNPVGGEHLGVREVTPLADGTMWATKELLEFISHVKNGDISILSQFDVQSLLLEYVKRNNLRDPRQKSQIICDRLLINLFGKVRVGHFEMLKLLEYHFLVKEKTPAGDAVRAGVTDTVGSQAEASGNNGGQMTMGNDRRRKTRKKTDEAGLQNNSNQDHYAAIDSYNINLLYLKRSLMESLMDDTEKFHEKVVGSFVRIRIPGGDQKQDMYRLVQVIGTSKVAETYKVGSRATDVMLEILNLDKKELVSIDGISNQDFSEDECKRLRQSIKCGLIKRLTVGEIQIKAMALQAVKVSDGLEAEVLRLNHLRDRASEKGHRKELRECVEKLELLKSPAELQRRLLEVAHVHTDSNMDPSFESDEDSEKKQGNYLGSANSGVGRTGANLNSALKGGDGLNSLGSCEQNNLDITCKQSQGKITAFYADRDGITLVHVRVNDTPGQVGEPFDLNDQNNQKNSAGPVGSMTNDNCTQGVVSSQLLSGVASPVLPASSATRELSPSEVETDKLWHYEDPSGKIQGPFSMMQLRKWSTSGLFPSDLRVWRINEKQDNSVLLTDALVGRFHQDQSLPNSGYLQFQEATVASKDEDKRSEGSSQTADAKFVVNKDADHSLKSVQNDGIVHCNGKDEMRNNERYSHSSSWTTLVDVAVSNHGLTQGSSNDGETSKSSKSWSSEPQISGSIPAPSTSGKLCETSSPQVKDHHLDEKLTSSPGNVNEHSLKTGENQPNLRENNEKEAESDSYSSLSSGQNWRPPPIKDSSGWDSNSGFTSAAKSIKTSDLNKEIDFSDLPNSSPKGNHEGLNIQPAENKQSVSSTVPVLDSGPSWSTASSLVVGGRQVSEVASEWGGSMTPSKPSTKEWDSNLVSASSLKPTEGVSGHTATPTPENDHLTHSPPTHPVIDVSSWQQIEPNEFCSIADESVSDLLAEVEAMESLGGLPSPTSKMRCEDLAQGSDNDCFSPVEGFCPTPEPGKSDALSSTGDIPMSSQLPVADDSLQLCHMLPQSIVTNELCQMSSQLPVTDQQLVLSHMSSRSTATAEFLGASQMPSPSTSTDEPPKVLHTDVLKPKTSFSTHSCSSAEVEGDRKLSELSVNQWEAGSGRQPPIASTAKRETGTEIQPPIASTVGQWGSGCDIQHTVSSITSANWGTMKGNTNIRQEGTAQGNTDTNWGTGHGTIQQHANVNTAASAGNSSSWGNQPRYGGDRFSGPREHRNYFQGRDSVFGRDRSWNKQPSYGVGNGGGSHRHPPKGQRVCKFYESGFCKKGASCSYWHPL